MPNDCRNTLTCISTPKSRPIGALLKPYLTKEADGLYNIDFGKIIAPKRDLIGIWGTPRNAYETELEEVAINKGDKGDTPLEKLKELVFFTADVPPIPVIRKLAHLVGESLRLAYFDQHEWLIGGVYTVEPHGMERDERYPDPAKVKDKGLRKELECDIFVKKIALSPKVKSLVEVKGPVAAPKKKSSAKKAPQNRNQSLKTGSKKSAK
jgi:hypothetical protein